jgi:hypothetical protein
MNPKENAPELTEAAKAKHYQADSITAQKIGNPEFLSWWFEHRQAGEYFWINSNARNPEQLGQSDQGAFWAGRRIGSVTECGDYPAGNGYFCVAALKPDNKSESKRKKANFSHLPGLVLDDIGEADVVPSYMLETSPGSHHIGFKLAEAIHDPDVADRLVKAVIERGLLKPDKSGNSIVRYMRLPAACNTKHSPPFQH